MWKGSEEAVMEMDFPVWDCRSLLLLPNMHVLMALEGWVLWMDGRCIGYAWEWTGCGQDTRHLTKLPSMQSLWVLYTESGLQHVTPMLRGKSPVRITNCGGGMSRCGEPAGCALGGPGMSQPHGKKHLCALWYGGRKTQPNWKEHRKGVVGLGKEGAEWCRRLTGVTTLFTVRKFHKTLSISITTALS